VMSEAYAAVAATRGERCAACAQAGVCRSVSKVRGVEPRNPAGFPESPSRRPRHTNIKEAVMAETWSGEFYCVKCKEKREASGEVKVNDKGTRMAKAVCPVCSTNLNRILGKA